MTNTDRKEAIMRAALQSERARLWENGRKHAAAAISELLVGNTEILIRLYDNIDNAVNNRPVGDA